MNKLSWVARRLRTMSAGEIGWRAVSAGRAVADERRRPPTDQALLGGPADWSAALAAFRAGTGRPVLLDRERAVEIAAAHPRETAAVVAAAERVVAGRVRYFGYPEVVLGDPVDWHVEAVSGVRWPAVRSTRLDHRTAAGDAKWIWELNRLQHLPWLAQAWLFTGDDRFADTAWRHLDGWLAQNPPGVGIAWRGAFEAGVRSISVAVALQGLRGSAGLTEERFRAVVRMLAESARRCWSDRSRFSSANNHLVGELAGLAVVALLLPELAGSAAWLRRALAGLSTEAALQVLPDGAGAEQAFAYQVFTGDLLLVVAGLLRRGGRQVPPPIVAGLRRSAGYLAALLGAADPTPRYGDDDEGFALRLDAAELPDARTHLAAVAAVLGEPAPAGVARPGLAAAWFGEQPALPAPAVPGSLHAADGGIVVLRSGTRRVTMDVGPLGYLSIAAHGHADALSVTLAVDGREVVGDPGAASYYGHPDWRRVHRGTPAHATVSVDGADQSVVGGPFLWTRHAAVRVREVDLAAGVVDAEHDGYGRLPAPVVHRRRLVAPPDVPVVLVVDEVTGTGTHEVRCAWPAAPDLDAAPLDGSGHELSRDGTPVLRLLYAANRPLTGTQVRGDADTGLGWWSERLEARQPSWLVGATVSGPVPTVLVTALVPAGVLVEGLVVTTAGRRIEVGWTEDGEPRRHAVDATAPVVAPVT